MIKKLVILILFFFDYFHNKKIFNFLKKKNLTKFDVFFDIGAHKGESINLFLKNFKINEIVSFEASPKNYLLLKKNESKIKKKYKNTKIILENIALGSEKKTAFLKQMMESSSTTFKNINKNSSYFKKKFMILNLLNTEKLYDQVEIKMETLKNYITSNKYKNIDFIKIDTEGFEYEIILGLNEEIKNVGIIMFEHHYDTMIEKNYSFSDIKRLMDKHNFKMIFKAKMPLRKTFEYIFVNKKRLFN